MAKYGPGNGMRASYFVEGGMDQVKLNPMFPLFQEADLRDKMFLLIVDLNVVKKGKVLDQYKINVTLPTMYNIVQQGGRPIIVSHIAHSYDKKTRNVYVRQDESVDVVVAYLQHKLCIKFAVPHLNTIKHLHFMITMSQE